MFGLYLNNVSDLQEDLAYVKKLKFNGLFCPIINPLHRNCNSGTDRNDAEKDAHLTFSRADLILKYKQWKIVIAKLNTEAIDCDSTDENFRRNSEKFILQEIQLAQHLISGGYMIVKLTSSRIANLAKIMYGALKNEICLIHVPITNETSKHLINNLKVNEKLPLNKIDIQNDPWTWWNKFRVMCNYDVKYRIALELTEELPLDNIIDRWLGEPIDCVIIPRNLFKKKTGRKDVVLSNLILTLLKKFMKNKIYFVLKGDLNDCIDLNINYDYLIDFMKNIPIQIDFNEGCEDEIFMPTQPMNDNIGPLFFPVVEADIIFSKSYQNAIELALIDRVPEHLVQSKMITLLILGTVRGILIKSALNAATKSKRKIKIYVIESNLHNLITVKALRKELWPNHDIIIKSDLNNLYISKSIDILITPSIGSFGDNELLPEILDKAKKFLKRTAISIPSQTISYLNPIMSSNIFNKVRYLNHSVSPFDKIIEGLELEGNYVIHLKNVYHISEPEECFKFNYPFYKNNQTILKTLHFTSKLDCILHGFAGYFEAVLYKDIILSIHPKTFSQGLLSYYTYYFPIKVPQMINANEVIVLNISRCTSAQKVWYEWQVNKPHISTIHNINGKSFSILKYKDE